MKNACLVLRKIVNAAQSGGLNAVLDELFLGGYAFEEIRFLPQMDEQKLKEALVSLKKEYDATLAKRDELVLEVKEKANLLENGNDADFIERAAREKLGYVYPDEHKYIDISGN